MKIIKLTKCDENQSVYINADSIESFYHWAKKSLIPSSSYTFLTLSSGAEIFVKETPEDILSKIGAKI